MAGRSILGSIPMLPIIQLLPYYATRLCVTLSSDALPIEIFFEIFASLPISSFGNVRSTCKQWHRSLPLSMTVVQVALLEKRLMDIFLSIFSTSTRMLGLAELIVQSNHWDPTAALSTMSEFLYPAPPRTVSSDHFVLERHILNLMGSHARLKSVLQPPSDVVFALAVTGCLALFEPRLDNPAFDPSTAENILIVMAIQYGEMDMFHKVSLFPLKFVLTAIVDVAPQGGPI